MLRPLPCLLAALALAGAAFGQKPTREQKVRADKAKVEAEGFWIYNDLPKAFATAKESGKPILVVLRCLPCEECVKLDDNLIENERNAPEWEFPTRFDRFDGSVLDH